MTQSANDQAFLLMLIILALGACFVWGFWEIDAMRERQQRHREILREARRTVGPGR